MDLPVRALQCRAPTRGARWRGCFRLSQNFMDQLQTKAPAPPFARGRTRAPVSAPEGQARPLQYTKIRPVARWSLLDWRELWSYRDLLWSLAQRDLKLRYRQTALGVLWVVFQPVAGAGVFSLVFGAVAGLKAPSYSYFLFSLSGLLVWNAFQSTLGKASMALISNGPLVSKVYFPRLLLPTSTLLSTLVDLGIGLCVFFLVGLATGWRPDWPALAAFPIWLGFALASALGVGLLAASLMTRFRDVQHVLPLLLPFLMYVSPVAYAMDAVPEHWRRAFVFNPVAWMLEGGRSALLHGEPIPVVWGGFAGGFAVLMLAIGVWCFRRMERSFADVL